MTQINTALHSKILGRY